MRLCSRHGYLLLRYSQSPRRRARKNTRRSCIQHAKGLFLHDSFHNESGAPPFTVHWNTKLMFAYSQKYPPSLFRNDDESMTLHLNPSMRSWEAVTKPANVVAVQYSVSKRRQFLDSYKLEKRCALDWSKFSSSSEPLGNEKGSMP